MLAGASAQEFDADDFLTVDNEEDIDVESVIFDFDDNTRLVNYDFNTENGTRLLFYSETPRTVEVYDVNGFTETGNEEIPINNFHLDSGYTEVLTDTTVNRGDRTVFMMVGDNYRVLSNSRTSELIGTPETAIGYAFGIGSGGASVFLMMLAWIKYKKRLISKRGVKRA